MSKTTDNHTTLKQGSCCSLSQTGIIGYEISRGSTGAIYISLQANSGSGYFSKQTQRVTEIIDALEQFESKYVITSLALKDLYPDTSINSWSFLMACLLEEGLVEKHPDQPRRFKLTDPEAFLARLEKLKPVAKAKATA